MTNDSIRVFWSDEDQAWIADSPDLRYCSALGPTPEEAVRQVQVAKELWLSVAGEDGRPIPEPSSPPELHLVAS